MSETHHDPAQPAFKLHTYYRSSCSARLRIALNLKGIFAEYVYAHLAKGEQHSAAHRLLNPSGTVPVLIHHFPNGLDFPITQSIAALEYLEKIFPAENGLLPPPNEPLERVKVRTLVNVIACDTQPVTNRSVARAVVEMGADHDAWQCTHLTRGLRAYEDIASKAAGKYSVGDQIMLANVCLVPCVWNAKVYGLSFELFPTVNQVYDAMMEHKAVQKVHWRVQEDTPSDGAWV